MVYWYYVTLDTELITPGLVTVNQFISGLQRSKLIIRQLILIINKTKTFLT